MLQNVHMCTPTFKKMVAKMVEMAITCVYMLTQNAKNCQSNPNQQQNSNNTNTKNPATETTRREITH